VNKSEKTRLVREVFRSVAPRYDIMNDLMSFGVHRLWKRFAVSQSSLRNGDTVLDVAGGSGDLSRLFADLVGKTGTIVLSDINSDMLAQGKKNLANAGIVGNIKYAIVDAEKLCFPNDYFHCVSIGFGLRNVTRKEVALKSMYRVLRSGGKLIVLEFSQLSIPILDKAYDFYSFNIIPKLGKLVAGDEGSYEYLIESIRQHPDKQTLRQMMLEAGFDEVKIHTLSGGIVALHIGFKY